MPFLLRALLPALALAAVILALTVIGAVRTAGLRRVIKFFPQRVLFEEPRISTMRTLVLLLRLVPAFAQCPAFTVALTIFTARAGILRLVVERGAQPVFP